MIFCNVVFLGVVIFGKNYLNWKAKNVADVQYKEQLTRIEETVKHAFHKEVVKMNFDNTNKLSIIEAKRDAIFKYAEALTALWYFSVTGTDKKSGKGLLEWSGKFHDLMDNYLKGMSRLDLFFEENSKVVIQARKLTPVLVDIVQISISYFSGYFAIKNSGPDNKETPEDKSKRGDLTAKYNTDRAKAVGIMKSSYLGAMKDLRGELDQIYK